MPFRGPWLKRCRQLGDRITGGFAWVVNREGKNKIYLVCKEKRSKRCVATASVGKDGIIHATPGRQHSHPPDSRIELVGIFIAALHDTTVRSLQSFRKIYDAIKILHPEGARQVAFTSIKASMSRWRKEEKRPDPASFFELEEMLQSDACAFFRFHEFGVLMSTCLRRAGSTAAMIGDIEFAGRPFLNNTNICKLYLGTTSRVLPAIQNTEMVFYAIASFRGYELGSHFKIYASFGDASDIFRAFPFAWALLDDPTPEIFEAILFFLRDEMFVTAGLRITKVVTDLHWNLRQKVTSTFGNAEVNLTFYDFCRVMLSIVSETIDVTNDVHGIILRKFMALTLLPAADIPYGLAWIVNTMSHEVNRVFEKFIDSFVSTFIEGLGLPTMSFHWNYEALEDAGQKHAQVLLNKVGGEPGIWKFLGGVNKIIEYTYRDTFRLLDNREDQNILTTPRIGYCLHHYKVKRLWRNYDAGAITISRFLATASFLLKDFYNELLYQKETMPAHVIGPRHFYEGDPILADTHPDINELLNELPLSELPILVRPAGVAEDEPLRDEEFPIFHYLPDDPFFEEDELPAAAAIAGEPEIDNSHNVFDIGDEEPGKEDLYNWLCCTCNRNRVELMCRPCKHITICQQCKENSRRNHTENGWLSCPQCNLFVASFERVFFPDDIDGARLCQVCWNQPIETLVEPCNHAMICARCAEGVRESARTRNILLRCPTCNTPATTFGDIRVRKKISSDF